MAFNPPASPDYEDDEPHHLDPISDERLAELIRDSDAKMGSKRAFKAQMKERDAKASAPYKPADAPAPPSGVPGSSPAPATAKAAKGGSAGGTVAGVALGIAAAALAVNLFGGGPTQAVAWLKAKFLNEVTAPTGAAAAQPAAPNSPAQAASPSAPSAGASIIAFPNSPSPNQVAG